MEKEFYLEFNAQIDPAILRARIQSSVAFSLGWVLVGLLVALSLPGAAPLTWVLAAAIGIFLAQNFERCRNMWAQKRNPDKIRLEEERLVYLAQGTKSFSIPLKAIVRVEYRKGIAIFVKNLNVQTLDPFFPLARFLARSKRKKCDLFFEWFDSTVKARLDDVVHANQSHDFSRVQHRQDRN